MSYMVSEYIIRPALQQVRRFSRSSATTEPYITAVPSQRKSQERPSSRDDVISETEEDSYLRDEESTSPPASSRSSVTPNQDVERLDVPIYERISDPRLPPNDQSLLLRHGVRAAPGVGSADILGAQRTTTGETDLLDVSMASLSMPDSSVVASLTAPGAVELTPLADRNNTLPEDDGMGALRKRILGIQARNLPAPEQARLMHLLLIEGYAKSRSGTQSDRPLTPSSAVTWEQKQGQGLLDSFKFLHDFLGEAPPEKFVLTEEEVRPTFVLLRPGEEESEYRALGCEHYRRNVKSQCSTCGHWYTCRFCHDKVEDHAMIAKDTKNMLCMFCGTAQKTGETCVSCAESAAMYYCSICKLWNNDPDKSIYHCNDCGICRRGRGLGKDFFHCKTCNACLNMSIEKDHRCIEGLLHSDCPICGEYMFNSSRAFLHMKCGHVLHADCFEEHIKHGYKCPICSKSLVNMETQFRNLDIAIEHQPMPGKFQDTRAIVLCNDCSAKTTVKYHWLGLKCAVCASYNTSQLQILGVDADTLERAAATVPDSQLLDSPSTNIPDPLQPSQAPTAREIPRRRRHSSNLMQLSTESLDSGSQDIGSYVVQDRLARSVSPAAAGHQEEAEESEEETDMIGFWSRVPRSMTSNESHGEECDSDDDSTSSLDEDDDMDEDDDDDEEEIDIFGHR
ncbi:CHY zinc finger protein [Xylariales sp. AK1849]|nr:CHY zinc finger protein [Xylariales sp. AK1849]